MAPAPPARTSRPLRACDYAAMSSWPRRATARLMSEASLSEDVGAARSRHAGVRTIAEVAAQLQIAPACTIKSLLYMAGDTPVLALVRGDHNLHERKLARALGAEPRPRARRRCASVSASPWARSAPWASRVACA